MLQLPIEAPVRDRSRAARILQRLSAVLPDDAQRRLEALLPSLIDPDSCIHHLEALQLAHPDDFECITSSPSGLQALLTVFSHSRFLADTLLQHPDWLTPLTVPGVLAQTWNTARYRGELRAILEPDHEPDSVRLAAFRRRHLLRILLRDVLQYATLSDVVEELSCLADAIIGEALSHISASFVGRYGRPRLGSGPDRCGFSVIALGKLGARELNYSSDIDLMFLYEAAGETDGAEQISNKEYFKKISNALTTVLSAHTSEGLCYRVDLRLRPDGSLGEVCMSLEGAERYYSERARDWELQMLIKARPAAGSHNVGQRLLDFVEPLIYASSLDFSAVEEMSETRERINEKLLGKRRGHEQLDIKLAPGGIRDIEFLVQCLQRLHGGRDPWVRHGGTLLALSRLRDKDLLSDGEYSVLANAYQFFRQLEHCLQYLDDRQTHTLPARTDDLALLAQRMPIHWMGEDAGASRLIDLVQSYSRQVLQVYARVIHAQQPLYYTSVEHLHQAAVQFADQALPEPSNVVRHLDQRAPNVAAALATGVLRRGYRSFDQFLERMAAGTDWLPRIENDPQLAAYVFDLFELSPYLAERMTRDASLIGELESLGTETPAAAAQRYHGGAAALESPAALREFFHREMFRIQAESCCLSIPVFTTLEQTTALADSMIESAYRLAVAQIQLYSPPARIDYQPVHQMMVVALGRLGVREFDLASDADLVFVLPDKDRDELLFWTRVAERLIEILATYTKHGVIFSVDTRLRPNGREGALVASESTYQQYFSRTAEAWEGIAYMKARAVAGDIESSTKFLNELQQLDWRRYGQGGRSRRDLKQMRLRVEKEQSAANPLKAGRGGYYDIDFSLMYLRLKGAGFFFKALNTPERIDIVEKMGHLDREDAELLREVATYYRAVDHGLRVLTGHAEGMLPYTDTQMDVLSRLVQRWTPGLASGVPLRTYINRSQNTTRQFFDRLFQ